MDYRGSALTIVLVVTPLSELLAPGITYTFDDPVMAVAHAEHMRHAVVAHSTDDGPDYRTAGVFVQPGVRLRYFST